MSYKKIVEHYEKCFQKHGDNAQGMDWPNQEDLDTRFKIMLDIVDSEESSTILDFGCGTGLLLDYMKSKNIRHKYLGADISQNFISECEKKYPDVDFYCGDILKKDYLPQVDYIVANGVYTEKLLMTYEDMFEYLKDSVKVLYNKCNKGVAFNVMSFHVHYQREDLFHVPHDDLAKFLTTQVTRNYVFRNDYGLYEYTTYVYK